MNRVIFLFSATIIPFILLPVYGKENERIESHEKDDYTFDPNLFRGSRFSQSTLARLITNDSLTPGNYKMDIYTNNKISGTFDVYFKEMADGETQPCLSTEIAKTIDIKSSRDVKTTTECFLLGDIAPGATSRTNLSQLRLDLSIPQSQLNVHPRGYVDPDKLDSGTSLAFMNYITNYYNVSYSGQNSNNQRSLWMSLNGGVNIGSWQYRQLSNLNWNKQSGSTWNNIRSYLQRPLPGFNSQLTLGQLITSGRFFSGLNYQGFSLATDERMLPDSMRGYAPVIRGVATTNARVSVMQNGQEIYQTTVAPGAFEINDLYPTSYNGDLEVFVTEANGSVSHFSVPFSAVPESMRPGISRFNLEMGKAKDSGDDALFGDITWQHGVTNSITVNSGARMADGYQALMLGGVHGSPLGALGMNLTYSHARLTDMNYTEGWMTQLHWSKTFQPSATTVSLAGYRYSTQGYRDLSAVLSERQPNDNHRFKVSNTRQQHSRFDLTLSQSMSAYGNLFMSGSLQNYREGIHRDTQLQLGYSNSFSHGISMNISIGRQRNGQERNTGKGNVQTITALSFSFPLGSNGPRIPSLSSSWTHSSDGSSQLQSSLSGMLDNDQTTSYGLNVMHDQQYRQTTIGGNMQKRFSQTTVGLNASQGKGYWQASSNVQGALALHRGGVTFGPYLGETFALVEAKGAEGAKVFNASQLEINNSGYALIPAVTPYRYNRISLDPQGMEGDAELIDSEKQVAPIAGAAVKVSFRTRRGKPLLIKSTLPDGSTLPMGADVVDEKSTLVGIVGQGGQIYLRTDQTKGLLSIRWGEGHQEQCQISYDTAGTDKASRVIRLNEICQA